jgi:hypothetical protein
VQQPDAGGRERIEALSKFLLPDRAAGPYLRALRVVGQRQEQSAESGMSGTDLLLAVLRPSLVFPPGRGSSDSDFDLGWVRLWQFWGGLFGGWCNRVIDVRAR